MFLAVQESSKGDSSFDDNMYINNLHEHCLAFTKNMGVSLNKCIEGHIALKGNISIGSPHIGHGNIEQTHTHTHMLQTLTMTITMVMATMPER